MVQVLDDGVKISIGIQSAAATTIEQVSIKVPYFLRRFTVRSGLHDPLKRSMDSIWMQRQRRKCSYSQFGEDREVLARLGPTGLYADVGANHAFKGSNTYLLYRAGWRGLTLEPIKSHCLQHQVFRPGDVCLNAAAGRSAATGWFNELNPTGFSTFDEDSASRLVDDRRAVLVGRYEVPIVTLAQAWGTAFGLRRPDFISIDTEGFEFEVLAGADLPRLQPKLVLLEFESAVDSGRRSALIDVMESAGYMLEAEFGVNGLFRRRGSA